MPTLSTTTSDFGVLAGFLLVAALYSGSAMAALGGPETAISTEALQLKGSVKSTERSNYRVHEIQMSSGTSLREFAGTDGKVFAVAWKGPTIPNLRQALGSYFDAYLNAVRGRHADRTHLEIREEGWVMQASGHMRAFQGRAYLPQSVPVGTSLDEIR